MIKLSDYIFKYLARHGVRHVFMISGGGAMHLVDSLGRQKEITYICPHHEQAAAVAAEGYARAAGKMGVVLVTSGPGGTNTLTGVIGQWLDSVPVLYLSGQVKRQTTIESCRPFGLRQLGDQEINIIDIVKPVTKYAVFVDQPEQIRFHLEKAIYLATHGRPGPVWLDIPLDIQAALIDETKLAGFEPEDSSLLFSRQDVDQLTRTVADKLKNAQRPIIIAGHGIRIAQARHEFLSLVESLNIPVVTSFCGFDLMPSDHPLFIGRLGTVGDRAGNFAVQNADLILSVGSRNNIRQVSYNWPCFGRAAYKIIVDIDAPELNKPTVKPDLAILSDAGYFLKQLIKQTKGQDFPQRQDWQQWCLDRRKKYPVVLPEYEKTDRGIQPYYFIKVLTEALLEDAVVVAGNGTACVTLFQAGWVKKDSRMFWNSGCAAMGYDLPAAIGAGWARDKQDVVCLAGDGSLQMNMQELQTIVHHQLPVKLFVLNNDGYISIKQTQDAFFNGHYVGSGKESGVSFPDVAKVAAAYGLPAMVIDSHGTLSADITRILATPGPVVVDVRLIADYRFAPKLSSEKKPDGRIISKPLEDMSPFLPREEFRSNMIVPTQDKEEDL